MKIALFLIIALAVAGPFFRQYYLVRKEMGFVREIGFSASFTSFLATSPLNRIYGDLTVRFLKPEGALFPGIMAFFLAVLGFVSSMRQSQSKKSIWENHAVIYFIIGILSFLFTFGSKGPYVLLYRYIPGFDGLRVASRFHIFVMFSMAVLAAFGIKAIFRFLKKRWKYLVIFLLVLVLVEYLSIPIPSKAVAGKEDIPEVYEWLAEKKDRFPIIELPLPRQEESIAEVECPRLYYSTFHWKRLVNGYSGYFPPLYDELKRRWQRESVEQNIEDLGILGVKYIILHTSLYEEEELKNTLIRIARLEKIVHPVAQLGESCVFELISSAREEYERISLERAQPIPKRGWTPYSNVNNEKAKFALDGDKNTRWESGPQRKGVFFRLDLGQPRPIRGLSLKLGQKTLDYPRGYRVEVSEDEEVWRTVAQEEKFTLPVSAFLRADDLSLDIAFPLTHARYIKIVNTGEHKVYYWSIYEMDIFE